MGKKSGNKIFDPFCIDDDIDDDIDYDYPTTQEHKNHTPFYPPNYADDEFEGDSWF